MFDLSPLLAKSSSFDKRRRMTMTKWMCLKTSHYYDCYFGRKMKNKIELLFFYQLAQTFFLFRFGTWMLFRLVKSKVANDK